MSINTVSANTTTKPATRPAGFTKREWDEKTVRAFKGLTMVVDGTLPHCNTSILKAYLRHPVVAELFSQCGIPADEQHVLMLLFAMVRERREERHIVTVSSLRKWFNGGWKVAEGKPEQLEVNCRFCNENRVYDKKAIDKLF